MCYNLSYPLIGEYPLPEKNVLVLSCIDLRLTDNLMHFLHYDNLTNRYDHFALAGTSLMTQVAHPKLSGFFIDSISNDVSKFAHWRQIWNDHLNIAIDLHDIKDVYIVEHQSCGAYTEYLKGSVFTMTEKECHSRFAHALAGDIISGHPKLNVHCFYIDLRGNVAYLPA